MKNLTREDKARKNGETGKRETRERKTAATREKVT